MKSYVDARQLKPGDLCQFRVNESDSPCGELIVKEHHFACPKCIELKDDQHRDCRRSIIARFNETAKRSGARKFNDKYRSSHTDNFLRGDAQKVKSKLANMQVLDFKDATHNPLIKQIVASLLERGYKSGQALVAAAVEETLRSIDESDNPPVTPHQAAARPSPPSRTPKRKEKANITVNISGNASHSHVSLSVNNAGGKKVSAPVHSIGPRSDVGVVQKKRTYISLSPSPQKAKKKARLFSFQEVIEID